MLLCWSYCLLPVMPPYWQLFAYVCTQRHTNMNVQSCVCVHGTSHVCVCVCAVQIDEMGLGVCDLVCVWDRWSCPWCWGQYVPWQQLGEWSCERPCMAESHVCGRLCCAEWEVMGGDRGTLWWNHCGALHLAPVIQACWCFVMEDLFRILSKGTKGGDLNLQSFDLKSNALQPIPR